MQLFRASKQKSLFMLVLSWFLVWPSVTFAEEDRVQLYLREGAIEDLSKEITEAYLKNPLDKDQPVAAVIPFQTEDKKLRKQRIGLGISEVLVTDLIQGETFRIVERHNLTKLLDEISLSMSGLINEESSLRVGKLLKADLLLLGSVTRVGDRYSIVGRWVRTDNGEVLASRTTQALTKDLHREAEEYLKLARNWALFFHASYVRLRLGDSPVTFANGRVLKNVGTDAGWFGASVGLRRLFFNNRVMIELAFPEPGIVGSKHKVALFENGKLIEEAFSDGQRIRMLGWFGLGVMQPLGRGKLKLSSGLIVTGPELGISGASSTADFFNWSSTYLRLGYEHPLRDRIALSLELQYLFTRINVFGEAVDPLDESEANTVYDFDYFHIKPVSLVLNTVFYF